ncbi:hypothetical protein [Streptomyces ochraceiscleroticus]|uniref:hypothetical protein n=1 Tax=Streptomyces ochraceiscleroticus TaxID=47761 RepID=UPI0004C8E60E|nr:hypothetical protein [Streptomyces ochraceiscleroticus]
MRMFARCTAALLGMTAGAMFLAPSAHGDSTLLTCEGEQTASYSPAMKNKEQTLTATVAENYDHCASSPDGIRGGEGTASFKEKASCLLTAEPGRTDEIQYIWDAGKKTSTVKFSVTNVVRAGDGTTTVTSVGDVTDGLGAGGKATRVVVLPALDLAACSDDGVPSQKGTATLKFVG